MSNFRLQLAISEATIVLCLIAAERLQEQPERTGNFSTTIERGGNKIEVMRDRFGRFTNVGQKIGDRIGEIIQEKEAAGLAFMEKFSVNAFGKEFTEAFKSDAQEVLAIDRGLRDSRANLLQTSADLYTKLFKGELTYEQIEARMIEANNRFANNVGQSLQGKNSQIDKLIANIKYLPEDAINRVEDAIGKLNKDVSSAISAAEANYQKMSPQIKSFVDTSIKDSLDTLSKMGKAVVEKLRDPGKSAQDAYNSVVKAAKEAGNGIKQKIDAAKKAGQNFLKEHRKVIDSAIAGVSMAAVGATGLFTNWAMFDAIWQILAVEGLQDTAATLFFVPGAMVWLATVLVGYGVGVAVYKLVDQMIEEATKEAKPESPVISNVKKIAGLK